MSKDNNYENTHFKIQDKTLEKLLVWEESIAGTVRLLKRIHECVSANLTADSSYINFLEEKLGVVQASDLHTKELKETSRTASTRSKHMLGMFQYFIELMKSREIKKDRIDINQLLNEVADEFRSRQHRIRLKPDKDNKPVLGDRAYLKHALMNLVDNALHFSESDLKVTLHHRASDWPHASIEVTDNGPGVPDHVQDEIFKPFYSSKTINSVGCGLGLPIAKLLIHRFEGRLEFDPDYRQGARFVIYLP